MQLQTSAHLIELSISDTVLKLFISFQVPVEAERLRGNDLILEQSLSLIMPPPLAGFRFDAPSVIKPRVTHSPASVDVDILQSSLTCLEDRYIFPAVLYIHVSAVQVDKLSYSYVAILLSLVLSF